MTDWEKRFDEFFVGTKIIESPARNLNIEIVKDFVKREINQAQEDLIDDLADIHSKIENPFVLGKETTEYLKFEEAIKPIAKFFMTKYQSLKGGKEGE